MRSCLFISLAVVCLWAHPAAAWTREEAQQVADAYAQELALRKAARQVAQAYVRERRLQVAVLPPFRVAAPPGVRFAPIPDGPSVSSPSPAAASQRWQLALDSRAAVATYKEHQQTVTSDFTTPYPELVGTLTYHGSRGLTSSLQGSIGHSLTSTETWDINGIHVQTNDLDVSRVTLNAQLGKQLPSSDPGQLASTAFLGYGVRSLRFVRSNFNILDIITIRDTVTESYWIQHVGGGLQINLRPAERLQVTSASSLYWVFFNEADNSL